MKLDQARQAFIDAWGKLGVEWGINRTMAQIHALLLISSDALDTDSVIQTLQISRGNASMNLRALIDWGLVDVFRSKHPDSSEFSWWDYRGGAFHRKQGLRIDFLLATKSLLGRVRSVEIDREYRKKKDGLTASDHAPVLADLD